MKMRHAQWLLQRPPWCSIIGILFISLACGERGGSVVECRTPEREVGGSRPTAAVLCHWARHFTPRKYWLITQEAVAPSRHDWKIVDWDVKPQHKQNKSLACSQCVISIQLVLLVIMNSSMKILNCTVILATSACVSVIAIMFIFQAPKM